MSISTFGVSARLGRFAFIKGRSALLIAAALFAFAAVATPSAAMAATCSNNLHLLGPSTVNVDQVSSAFTVSTSNSCTLSSGGTVTLDDGAANGTFYSDSNGTNPISSVTLSNIGASNTSHSATFYYKDTVTGSRTIKVTSSFDTSGDSKSLSVNGAPDLSVSVSNSVSGNGIVNTPFNWVVTITNTGNSSATFSGNFLNAVTIFTDNLPTSGATYGTVADVNGGGTSGTVNCSISSNTLSCKTNSGFSGNDVVIPANGTISITVPVTPTANGTLTNPKSGGTCKVDPDSKVSESNESNNTCSDTVTVASAPLTNQTITVTTHAPASAVNGTSFPVAAGASSGLTVAVTATGGCTVAGGTVTMNSDSTDCVVHYNQAGNGSYNPAPEVTETTAASAAAPACTIDTAENLIENPCFDTGFTHGTVAADTVSNNWTPNAYSEPSAAFSIVGDAHSGANAAQVSIASYVDGGDAKWVNTPDIAVNPGEHYNFSFWYKLSGTADAFVIYTGDNFQWIAPLEPTDTWTKYEGSFSVPTGASSVQISAILSSVGTLTTDDYSLVSGAAALYPQGIVSLTFDDGWTSFFNNGAPVLDTAGYKGTSYIITGPTGSNIQGSGNPENTDYMSLANVQSLATNGWEIGAHTRSHVDLTTLSGSALTDEVGGSRTDLTNKGLTVDTFAYPLNKYNLDTVAAVQAAGFIGARTVDDGFNDKLTPVDMLKSQEVTTAVSVAQVKSWIDTALANKTWLTLLFHKVVANQADCGSDTECITSSDLAQIVAYLKASHACVQTVSQVLHDTTCTVNSDPVLDPIAAQDAHAAAQLTFTAHATDVDNDTLAYSLTGTVPAGAAIDSSGEFSWTPTADQVGATTTTITVSDGHGGTASQVVTITVVDDAPTITLTGDAEVTVEYGSEYTDAGATATDAVDGDLTSSITTVNPVNTAVLGDYTVTYNVPDSHGNAAPQVTRTVHVVPRAVTVTATNASKIYEEVDPIDLGSSYTLSSGELVGSDAFTGAVAREAGEAVGTYAITQGTLTLGANYTLTFVPGTFTITAIPGTVTLSNLEYTYDGMPKAATVTTDPGTLTTTVTYEGAGDTTYPLSATAPTSAGTYTVTATVDAGQGYEGTATGELVIHKAVIELVADNQVKAFGAADPALTVSTTSGALFGADAYLTATLSRAPGESLGTYAIDGTFDAGSNYDVSLAPGTFSIVTDPNNQIPTADSQSVSLNENSSIDLTLVATDPEAAALAWTVNDPAHGTLSNNNSSAVTYTPAPGYYGTDSFTFTANDGNSDSNTATVSILVNLLPTCPSGYATDGTQCVPVDPTPVAAECASGTAYNAESGLCEGTNTTIPATPSYTCDEGATLNDENMCVPAPVDPVAPTCDVGSYNTETHQCEDTSTDPVTVGTVSCPTGMSLENDQCVGDTTPVAPTETLTCSDGYTLDGENCVPNPVTPTAPVCPVNTADNGDGTCTPQPVAFSCLSGYHTAGAICEADVLHVLSASAGEHGSISPSGDTSVIDGGSQTYAVSADSGYHISDVLVDGASVGAVSSYTFDTVTETHTISASFAQDAAEPQTTTTTHHRSGGGGSTTKPGLVLGASTGGGLTEAQIQAILDLLKSFNADQSVIDAVNASLHGQATAPAAAGTGFVFTQTLQLGSTGNEVTELQKVLIAGGYLTIAAPTGYFGSLTEAAVKAYQTAHGLPAVGIVGPLTRAALNAGK